jgi:methylation protein EvaC
MPKCRICNADYEPFISYGRMPIANGFIANNQMNNEYFFELKVGFCPKCSMVQIVDQPEREMMFNENYAFFSGTSKFMTQHFKEFAEYVMKGYIESKDPFVVEIGSNDGIMLQNFAVKGVRHLGVEPSANVAQVAIKKQINTINKFFDQELARQIVENNGQADVYLAANCMCHIPYLHSVAEGIKILLKPDGVAIFEDPYLGDVIEKTSYDQIYDEHVFLFTVSSINYLFNQHSMEVVDVEPQETHGGSMRYVIAHKGARKISENVVIQLAKEKKMGLGMLSTYEKFRDNCEESKRKLKNLLVDLKKTGKRVVGYAATSKSTTVINYCGITPDLVEFISDTTPIKQGKYSPGMHIPIRSHDEFKRNYPEYALLFGWNHAKEIMAKEQDFIALGGKWIMYIPEVKVLV